MARPVCVQVDFVYPPVPVRHMDWCACIDGQEEDTTLQGWGATREAAVAKLFEAIEDEGYENEE
jgi:hypothetical protein